MSAKKIHGELKEFSVAVFNHNFDGDFYRSKYAAYTRWYSEDWDGCRMFQAKAVSGCMAKRAAVDMAIAEDMATLKNKSG